VSTPRAPAASPRRRHPRPWGSWNVRVGRSGVHGRGLFAKGDLRKGERVIEYVGPKVGKKEGVRRTERQWKTGRLYVFELNRRYDVDGGVAWNTARLANHSCDPNCESVIEGGRIWIEALRDIGAGEEITYDYNFSFVDPPPVCLCGAKKCRGYIVGEEHAGELVAWLREHGNEKLAAKVERDWVLPKRRKRVAGKARATSSKRSAKKEPTSKRKRKRTSA